MSSLALSTALALALLGGGCVRAAAPGPGYPGQEAERHRAALAVITVENGTAHHLRIAFRAAVGPGGEVVVGSVPPDSTTTLAPIPAGEPLLLSAIAEDSSRLALPPRSFELGEHWTWRIPADAAFTPVAPHR